MKHPKITHYIRWLAALFAILAWNSACTHIKPVPISEGSTTYTLECPWKNMTPVQTLGSSSAVKGKATWYGKEFHRRRTTSGERFNMYGYTAAHRSLPLGTRVLVTNLANGKSVMVRVNDRGPRSRRWIIDLSYAAARKIGMRGTGDVSVERLDGSTVSFIDDDPQSFSLQAGSFKARENAEGLMTKLGKDYEAVCLVEEKGLFKVRVGSFDDPHLARDMKEDLESKGYQVFTVRKTPGTIALADKKTIQSRSDE